MIANFEQIEIISRENAREISSGGTALGPVVGGTRLNLYDSLWGYFTFGQSTSFSYDDTDAYQDVGSFTIDGSFTHNAEVSLGAVDSETGRFLALSAKYDALEKFFSDKANEKAPEDYSLWGTALDPRCIALPNPLRDKDGDVIYALPESLTVSQSRYPSSINYSAVLNEARFYGSKILVNDLLVDNGSIQIEVSSPELTMHDVVAASGSIIQFKNWTNNSYSLSGTIPNNQANDGTVSEKLKDIIRESEFGRVSVKIAYIDDQNQLQEYEMFRNQLIESPSASIGYESESTEISFTVQTP